MTDVNSTPSTPTALEVIFMTATLPELDAPALATIDTPEAPYVDPCPPTAGETAFTDEAQQETPVFFETMKKTRTKRSKGKNTIVPLPTFEAWDPNTWEPWELGDDRGFQAMVTELTDLSQPFNYRKYSITPVAVAGEVSDFPEGSEVIVTDTKVMIMGSDDDVLSCPTHGPHPGTVDCAGCIYGQPPEDDPNEDGIPSITTMPAEPVDEVASSLDTPDESPALTELAFAEHERQEAEAYRRAMTESVPTAEVLEAIKARNAGEGFCDRAQESPDEPQEEGS